MRIRTRRRFSAAGVAALWIALGPIVAVADRPLDPLERSLAERRAEVARQPDDAGAWIALGDLLALLGSTEEAEQAFRRVLELDPAAGHYQLGRLWSGTGRRFAARRELARALDLAPDHAGAHYELGVVYDAWDFDRLARRHFTRAFALDPALADPDLNPFLGQSRQALAALLVSWRSEPAAVAATAEAAPGLAPEPAAEPPTAAEESSSTAPATGGFARSSGSPARDAERAPGGAVAPGEPVELDAESLRDRGAVRRESEPGGRVLDAGSLAGGSVNQIVSPGGGTRGGARSMPSRRPVYPPPAPTPDRPGFRPMPESTGRIERGLDATDPERYALGSPAG